MNLSALRAVLVPGLVIGLVLGLFCAPARAETPDPLSPLDPGRPGAAGRRTPIVAAIEKARPAVVSVYAQTPGRSGPSPFTGDPLADDFFRRFFELGPGFSRPSTSLGSGVVIDGRRGLVVTNEHVCAGASRITVALADGRELPAELLGADPGHDLAVLEIKAGPPLPQLNLGDSDGLMIGETVIAIGNPFGLTHTATVGIVSATGREVPLGRRGEVLKDLIQTDAAINPGNSGGPLLNLDGDLVGLNTAIIRGDGLGFAIPSNQIRRVAARLARGGSNLDLGLDLAESSRPRRGETGCLVIGLAEGGPAAAGGLKKGDLLRKLDQAPVDALADYELILASLDPDRPVTAEATREGRPMTFTLTPRPITAEEALALAGSLYGLAVSEQPGRLLLKRPPDSSPAARAGLREGDLLLALGDRRTAGLRDLAEAALAARFKPAVAVTIQRGRALYRTTLAR